MIYLDNATTTVVYPEVLEMLIKAQQQFFANPDALYQEGAKAQKLIDDAKIGIANLLAINANEIVFTSGATESNNLALQGTAFAYQHQGKHIITTNIEHASVSNTLNFLEQQGFEVTYLPVNEHGIITLKQVMAAITQETILISIMHINNEIGSIQPIFDIAQAVKKSNPRIIMHSDMAQSVGKIAIDLTNLDLATFSGHKFHAPKGIGMLYKKNSIKLQPLLFGGQQQNQLRPGTQNPPLIAAFAKAMRLSLQNQKQLAAEIQELSFDIRRSLEKNPDTNLTIDAQYATPYIIHFSIEESKTEIQTYINALDAVGIYVSTRSACHSKVIHHDNPIMLALGYAGTRSRRGIRVSLSSDTTKQEIAEFLTQLFQIIQKLQL